MLATFLHVYFKGMLLFMTGHGISNVSFKICHSKNCQIKRPSTSGCFKNSKVSRMWLFLAARHYDNVCLDMTGACQ